MFKPLGYLNGFSKKLANLKAASGPGIDGDPCRHPVLDQFES
jgi:hypothetical protein